jgi:pimeloyl-ACP methyl ester carboxylesterase
MQEEKPVNRRTKILRWLKIFIIIYCVVGIAAYQLQEKFLFHPAKLKQDANFSFSIPFREVNIPVDNSTKYNLVQFAHAGQLRGVVLYFHGNKGNIERYAPAANLMTRHGYEVWMIDYPGYGKSTGKFTEQVAYELALQLYKMARVQFSPDSIIIYGRSLGTGIATQLASIRDCKRLILETPYYSFPSLARTYLWMYPVNSMIKYKFPTGEYLQNVTAPVSIFHGTNDAVIPYRNALRLKKTLKPGDQFFTITGGRHNNLASLIEMTSKLDSLLSL